MVLDPGTLRTLPPEEVANGLSEMVKYGAIADETLFAQMASGGYDEARAARCVEIKADFVRQDEHDGGARQALNFGHTIGHAIERASNFLISHGRAVAIGMALVARRLGPMGWCSADTANAIVDALRGFSTDRLLIRGGRTGGARPARQEAPGRFPHVGHGAAHRRVRVRPAGGPIGGFHPDGR